MSPDKRSLPLASGDGKAPVAGAERTVARVGGMDRAGCAVTVERRVSLVSSASRAAVNSAAGRLEVDHSPEFGRTGIEGAVEEAGGRSL